MEETPRALSVDDHVASFLFHFYKFDICSIAIEADGPVIIVLLLSELSLFLLDI